MEPLSIKNALRVAQLLSPFLSRDVDEPVTVKVKNMLDMMSSKHCEDRWIQATVYMSGLTLEQLKLMDSIDIIQLFIDGLEKNKILSLLEFYDSLGLV